ncbi:MAG: strawberry notch C-terminal domain-containing protein, partial [Sedimentisphaerales bacterium]
MGNAVDSTGGRYTKRASRQALAGVALQLRLPKARVVYTSATGATTVMNLAYAERLGLWGEGTAFADKMDFIQKISSGGIAAMELVATDMKAMGLYMSRSLSYDGVEQETLVHNLSTEQINSYNKLVEGWQVVLNNIQAALIATGAVDSDDGHSVMASAVSNAMSAFWGANQRFFNQVITSMQTPTLIKKIRKDLAAGHAPVVQLTSTFEAATKRALARLEDDQTLDDLDLTPRDGLMQLVQGAFPVAQVETYVDDHGNEQSRFVRDSKGNIVLNSEAVAMREKLLDEIGSIAVPQGSLDMLLDEFGTDVVAEVTGRTKRVVNKITEKGTQKVVESWSRVKSTNDVDLFMKDRKKILVFSEAGGTGRSYHSDLSAKNQRKRIHYLIQPGWRADKAIQGLGRTHRSNQATPPKYYLVTTDLKGQKRFVA